MTARRHARLARWLWCEVIRRPLPHGLVHWRYLLPLPPGPLAWQRSLWLGSGPAPLPRPAWLAVEAWLWLKWQLWCGPASIWRAVRRVGPRVRDEEGVGLARQARRVAALSLGYCLPPGEIYRYRLLHHPQRAPEFVYDHTAVAFHQQRNPVAGRPGQSLRLLQDKERLAAELSALGVPVVATLAVARQGSGARLGAVLAGGGPLFCKPRHGSGGRGAAVLTADGGAVSVRALDGRRLKDADAERWWARQLRRDDMLLQPRLLTHPDLAGLGTADDVATVRYISHYGGSDDRHGVSCYCATLELPAGRPGPGRPPHYVVLELEPRTGRIGGFPLHLLPREAAARHRRVLAGLGERVVPGWEILRRASHVAHRRLPCVRAIAWDWAISRAGPLLLEGNGGWGPATPQLLRGGLLAGAPGTQGAGPDGMRPGG